MKHFSKINRALVAKKKLTFFLALMMLTALGVQAGEKKVYTSYNSSTQTLTYYYDDQYGSRSNVEYYDQDYTFRTRWADYHDQVKKVTIDASMKNATLSSMQRFFIGGTASYPLSNMTTITGLGNLNTANVTSMYAMFEGCYKLQSLNLSSFNTSKVTDMSYMFYDCRSLTSLDLSSFNTSNVTGMYSMFVSCFNLQSLNLSSFKTSNVTHMGHMFEGCYSLTSLDVSHFNTSKVTNMVSMFDHCEKLGEINVDNFDVSKVEDISRMFFDCQALRTIYCSQDWSKKTGIEMFNYCLFLVGGDGTAWSEDKRMDSFFARPDGLDGKTGYFTSTICPEPTNVKASYVSYTSAYISWSADESAKNFYVSYYPASNNTSIKEIETTSTSCTLTNLEPGEKYYVYVVAQCQKDVTSNDNPTKIHFTTSSCTAPTNLKYSNVTENSATISWTPGASDQTQWYITYKSKDQSDFYSGEEVNTTSFTLNNLQPETKYEVKVKAICGADLESDYSESIFFTTPKPVASAQAYTVFDGTDKLTYYYDNKYEEYQNAGKAVQMYYGTGGCATDDYCEQVQTINIDPSMKNYTPEKMRMMFCSSGEGSMSALNAINGIENLNTSKVTDMSGMFMKCGALKKIDLSSLNTSNVVNMSSMFADCEKLATITGIETLNTSKVTNMQHMFEDCDELVNLDLHKWDVSNVVNMSSMFYGSEKLATITGIETLNTSKVTNMQYMFLGCNELVKLDLHKWDVSNVTNMSEMFCSCKNLQELDLTGFDVSNVENMFCMFFECQNLTTIYCEKNWKDMATKLTESRGMFSSCEALKGDNNTIFSYSNPNDITYARPDDPDNDQPGYFSKKEVTAIDEINPSAKFGGSQKILRNAQLLILRGDKVYTITGIEVK